MQLSSLKSFCVSRAKDKSVNIPEASTRWRSFKFPRHFDEFPSLRAWTWIEHHTLRVFFGFFGFISICLDKTRFKNNHIFSCLCLSWKCHYVNLIYIFIRICDIIYIQDTDKRTPSIYSSRFNRWDVVFVRVLYSIYPTSSFYVKLQSIMDWYVWN